MTSPCQNCKRRKVGCHNVDSCKAWRDYVEKVRMAKEKRLEDSMGSEDYCQHIKRHGGTLSER